MKFRLLFLVCLLPARLFAADAWYESNSIGVLLRPVEKTESGALEYVLHISRQDEKETRTLFDADGKQTRRWERLYAEEGFPVEETVYIEDALDSRTLYYPSGLVKEEILFTNGEEDGRFLFTYSQQDEEPDRSATPFSVSFLRPSTVGFRDEYQYLPSGDFRGIKRIYEDGVVYTAMFTTEKSILRKEWHSFGNVQILFRYDRRGNLSSSEEYRDAVLVERAEFRYDTESPFRLREKITYDTTGGEVRLEYGEDGNPLRESVFEDGARTIVTLLTYENNLLVRKRSRHRGGREEWIYTHDEDKKLVQENYLRDGETEMILYYDPQPEYTRIEEYYRNGEIFLRLYFRDNEETGREIVGEDSQ
jgi:antitoxin component YwqK of YwqJK toxin-antitoxin module